MTLNMKDYTNIYKRLVLLMPYSYTSKYQIYKSRNDFKGHSGSSTIALTLYRMVMPIGTPFLKEKN